MRLRRDARVLHLRDCNTERGPDASWETHDPWRLGESRVSTYDYAVEAREGDWIATLLGVTLRKCDASGVDANDDRTEDIAAYCRLGGNGRVVPQEGRRAGHFWTCANERPWW
jgi:hypothetical protein